MKVGTDGVLLGAWAKVCGERLLDIGTGTGLVALMAAQRWEEAQVVGVEIDEKAALQAQENVNNSPYASRVSIVNADIRELEMKPFDCILCNPPFFTEDTLPEDASRALARNASALDTDALLAAVNRLLSSNGQFSVILPYDTHKSFVSTAFVSGFNLIRQCEVHTLSHKAPKRVLLTFSRDGQIACTTEKLVLQNLDGSRTKDYEELTKDFYL
ncbi:MAG: methyltransferase [Bacteroidaceae bacterium]|nr:methyltransferase [Bacteroidaceae bacterium]